MNINLINTREDLDELQGTPAHDQFMQFLKGSMTRKQDTQTYPEGYGQVGYTGATLAPIWTEIEDLTLIQSFGFTKNDFKNI